MTEFDMGPDLRYGRSNLGDYAALSHCLDLLREQGPFGRDRWAVEFGVGYGHTIRMIAAVLPVIGFDSFDGLPEDWRPGFPKGYFGDAKAPTNVVGATIVPGLFAETVRNYDWPDSIPFVHLDADLYSSTATALIAVQDSVGPGTILLFDEFFGYDGCENHEQRAFFEFIEGTGHGYEVLGHGREQWAVRLR